MSDSPPVVIVHGGAGTHAAIVGDPDARAATETGVVQAARIGYGILVRGGSSLDAVEAAVISLEDNPTFNAGNYLLFQCSINVILVWTTSWTPALGGLFVCVCIYVCVCVCVSLWVRGHDPILFGA